MDTEVEMVGSTGDCVVFTVWIEGSCYLYPVPHATLYALCRKQDETTDQIEAYMTLKRKVQRLAERTVRKGHALLPQAPGSRSLMH